MLHIHSVTSSDILAGCKQSQVSVQVKVNLKVADAKAMAIHLSIKVGHHKHSASLLLHKCWV